MGGCGFEPLYSARSNQELQSIKVEVIADRRGQRLRNLLKTRLNPYGPPQHPKYTLKIDLTEGKTDLDIRTDATTSLKELSLSGKVTLKELSSQKEIFSNTLTVKTNFNILEEPTNPLADNTSDFSTMVAEDSALVRATTKLAEEIRLQLASHLQNRARNETTKDSALSK